MSTTTAPTSNTLAQLRREYERLEEARRKELQRRFQKLETLKANIETEMLVLADEIAHLGQPPARRRRSRYEEPECGTESGYQRHRHRGETCEECRQAHRDHERVAAARRKLRRLAEQARGGK